VHITASTEGGRLRMVVSDTGRGFSETPGAGVGLANIRERLAALYGAGAKLTLEANSPRGVVATIEVPVEGTRSQAAPGACIAGAAAGSTTAPLGAAAPAMQEAPLADPAPAAEGFWPRTWEILVKLERGWRKTLYYVFLVMVGVAAVAAVGLFIAAAAGFVPVQFGEDVITGPVSVLFALAGAVIAFLAVSLALAIVTLVLYGLGFFLFALAIFVACVVTLSLSPVLAPFILLGLAIWYFARKKKAPSPGPAERIEPKLAE
jgi:hypothetical protein